MSIYEKMVNPPKKYRAIPFWSWNDRLEPEELKRQIAEMDKAGLGGYFMHARGGLETPYLQEEWMKCIQACIDEGDARGMGSWCYDENGWPSGFADGIIPAMGVEYQQKWLVFEHATQETCEMTERTVAIYRKEGNSYRRISTPDSDSMMLHIYYAVDPYYIDILDAKVVRAFIESTYERYYKEFQEHFGQGLKGIFTDEPQYSRRKIPWSYILEEAFQQGSGYGLLEVLPALYYETNGYEKIRYDYWKTVTNLYVNSFGKQIGQWCEEHNCQLTGHVMGENSLSSQLGTVGDAMAFYEYMQLPGIDWLGRKIDNPIIPKQVSSVAHQLGKKQVISETFGCAGWNVSFEELKRIAEWQYVHGINLMCQHLESYSLRGLRKRDYPPSLYYQQPWWDEYRQFNDYFARLGMLLSEGTHIADILLIHPIRTGWITYNSVHNERIESYNDQFSMLSEMLCQAHFAHDYGCEAILEKYGRIEDGRIQVGQAAYRMVMIPPALTLADATVRLLEQFLQHGGKVIAFEPFPILVDGMKDERLQQLKMRIRVAEFNRDQIKEHLLAHFKPAISITEQGKDAETVYYQHNELEGASLFYLVNLGQEKAVEAEIFIAQPGFIEQIDLGTGELRQARAEIGTGGLSFKVNFEPVQSYMFRVTPMEGKLGRLGENGDMAEAELVYRRVEMVPVPADELILADTWRVEREDLNSITLDLCRLRIADGEWSGPEPVILLQEKLLQMIGAFEIELEFTLQVSLDTGREREMYLVLEQPEQFEIRINGQMIPYREIGWWRDVSFKKVNIAGALLRGSNAIGLKRRFTNSAEKLAHIERAKTNATERNRLTFDCEIESIYVVGNFAVFSDQPYTEGERKALFQEGSFTLAESIETVKTCDLVVQGYPFFAGSINLSQTIVLDKTNLNRKVMFSFHKPDAVLSKLRVNGRAAKVFLWGPYEAEIQSFLQEGENCIEIELFSSLRNLLGPHHHISGELYFVGTNSFKDKPGWTDEHLGVDHIYTDRYCFVKFGLVRPPKIRFYNK
ncbi:MAG TPA: glycosyl hydrolase [Bacilli bacterium]